MRGSSDDKGQLMVSIAAADVLLHTTGTLPANLKFLIEGEEENGGEVVNAYLHSHDERLHADVAQIADGAMFAAGVPTIDTGLRGTVYTEITARGAASDLHSGVYGGIAPNPLNALAHVIASLKNTDGRIQIPGFYDAVEMPRSDVLDTWEQLPFDADALRSEIGASDLVGEPGFSELERMWARPTLDVHGIAGGVASSARGRPQGSTLHRFARVWSSSRTELRADPILRNGADPGLKPWAGFRERAIDPPSCPARPRR
jgi:acetylornithine deacetylase/succinyl-diaminopimelate desuccinylase-like protein